MANMKLYALTDFPDDCGRVEYTPEMVDSLIQQLVDGGFSRMYFQYYGNQDNEYYWTNQWKGWWGMNRTAELMPNMSKVYVEACKRHGMETAGVMRPLEQITWVNVSPYHEAGRKPGVKTIGGTHVNPSAFLSQHPEMRIKRRTYDFDETALEKTIGTIKLYKQNNVPTRIQKENITIYVSKDNSYYKPYSKDFSFEITEETAREDVVLAVGSHQVDYGSKLHCKKGDPICVIKLSDLAIEEQFAAIGIKCSGSCSEEEHFVNTCVNGIACFTAEGEEICASPGNDFYPTLAELPRLEEGFNFDDGFGVHHATMLDPDGKEGYIAIAKGKNLYNHGALCECEPLVQKHWLSFLENALADGYDFIGNRIECHAVHVNEPYAYGYNDAIKKLYFETYGECSEEEMERSKIAKIRGDVYTELFKKGAEIVRDKGGKVYVTLNIEMLYDPIPLDRLIAYPMNVEWQWKRWLEEIKPDEINFRMFKSTPEFLLRDQQCKQMLEIAKSYGVPMTVERYITKNLVEDYKLLNETGLFDAMIVYETCVMFHGTPEGTVVPTEETAHGNIKEMLAELKRLKDEK